ncbi:MAG: FKBP-type peptidyl-prolyl cis-trans isomerase [Phycisphaerae bacterium]|nr:FKBP-type peptidyl-prolyl cis-trans isomerase [Gemmatimonadaceae bacterium]
MCGTLSACVLHRKTETTSETAKERVVSTMPAIKGKPVTVFALRHVDTRIGTGAPARPRACFYAHYTGWLTNGKQFDSSRDTMPNGRPRSPISFAQGARRVISGWDIGFEGMKVGGQRRLFIPYQLGYGELGRPPAIPARAELIFDVELVAMADTLPRTEPTPRGQTAPPPQCPAWAAVSATK